MIVEVQIEIGHYAAPRSIPTNEGYTHDWTVYVQGVNGCNIECFVEKVIFQLHESFPRSRRVIKDPPYEISESGYAGFELPVEIHFRTKEEPRKIMFEYDLFLRLDSKCTNSRREKLIFQNPNAEFKDKLLKAGGQQINDKPMVTVSTASPGSGDVKYSSNKSSKSSSLLSGGGGSSNDSGRKSGKMTSVIPSKDKSLHNQHVLNSSSSSHHHSHHSHHSSSAHHLSSSTSSSASHLERFSDKTGDKSHDRHGREVSSHKNHADPFQSEFTNLFGTPIQTRPPSAMKAKDNVQKAKSRSKESKESNKSSSKKSSHEDNLKAVNGTLKHPEEKESREKLKEKKHKSREKERKKTKERDRQEREKESREKETRRKRKDRTWDDEENGETTAEQILSSKSMPAPQSPHLSLSSNHCDGSKLKMDTSSRMSPPPEPEDNAQRDKSYIKELIALHKKINSLEDVDVLQRIVDIIEETGLFKLTETSIAFDLMRLDKCTVKKLKTVLI